MPSTAKSQDLATVIGKASVLLEAMPYFKTFRGKIFVIKSGGMALTEGSSRSQFLQDLLFLSLTGIKPVLVHGGGTEISERLRASGLTPQFVEGLRVTDRKTLKIVSETLLQVNQRVVLELKQLGGGARGLSGARHRILKAKRLRLSGRELGFVGTIERVDPRPIRRVLEEGRIPVIVPLAHGVNGQEYNVNADQAGASIAAALTAEKFVLITDVRGILRDETDPESLLSTVSAEGCERLIQKGIVRGGMIPKTKACIQALRAGVKKTHMIDYRIPHGLLLEIFTDRGIGTEIVR